MQIFLHLKEIIFVHILNEEEKHKITTYCLKLCERKVVFLKWTSVVSFTFTFLSHIWYWRMQKT